MNIVGSSRSGPRGYSTGPAITFDKFISTSGNDTTGDGSFGTPWRTVAKGLSTISAGQTLGVRGGTYSGETLTSSHNGTNGSPKVVRAYTGEQVIFNSRFIFNTGCADISFIGHDDVRHGRTQDTISFRNSSNSQHVIEMYGTRIIVRGCDISHEGGYLGSCIAMGWNGSSGQYRAVDCEAIYCLFRDVGTDPGLTNSDAGHDHGIYLNYNLDCVVERNVFKNIQGGWGIHCYTESGSARHVDGTSIRYNTIYDTRDGGIILASDSASTTNNSVVDFNLCSDCGNTALTTALYSYTTFWGGPTGSGNTGNDNHSYNPADDHVQPSMTGWTLEAPSTGDPDFENAAGGDFRLGGGSPAAGRGAYG